MLISIANGDDKLSGFGVSLGTGYQCKSIIARVDWELLHTSSMHERLKYDVIALPNVIIFSDQFNEEKINAAISFAGFFDFIYQFSEGPVNDLAGITMALLGGRIFWELNNKVYVMLENSLNPIIFRRNKWWMETIGTGLQFNLINPPCDENGVCNKGIDGMPSQCFVSTIVIDKL